MKKYDLRSHTEEEKHIFKISSISEILADVFKSYKTSMYHDVGDWELGTSETN